MAKLTLADLAQMKRDKKKIAAAVAYDYQMAQILDRAGADLVSVGDSAGTRFFGHTTQFPVTMDQMVLCCQAVSQGVNRAVVNCDLPFGPIQISPEEGVRAAIRLVKEGGAEMVKVDGAAECPDAVRAIARAGIPVFAQFGFTPQTTAQYGGFTNITDQIRQSLRGAILEQAKMLEEAGASMFDCTNVGNDLIGEIAASVSIPVLGGYNTGPKADGRITVSYGWVGYGANNIDQPPVEGRVNVGRIIYESMAGWLQSVRDGTAAP